MLLKNDDKRYRALIKLHGISHFMFILRFIVLCTDLSSGRNEAIVYPIIILLMELGTSFVMLVLNSIYLFLRYFGRIIFESDREKFCCCSQSITWTVSTLTCFSCDCYRENPTLVLLLRFLLLLSFQLIRLVAFILACVCANRFTPVCLGYAIVAGFSLVPDIVLLVVEYLHHHRVWFNYYPDHKTENEEIQYVPQHLGFFPLNFTNDQRTSHWHKSLCPKGNLCRSQNLYHIAMHHAGNTRYPPEQTMDNQIVVGFHQTKLEFAYSIARTNFKPSAVGMIGGGTYFATCLNHTEFKANQYGAYILAVVDLGKTKRVKRGGTVPPMHECDTVYFEHETGADEFCVHNLAQIRSWITLVDQEPGKRFLNETSSIAAQTNALVNDRIDEKAYSGCFFFD